MAPEPGGVLAISSRVALDALDDFRRWHRDEHLPQRLALPGFLEARRYRSIDRPSHFLTLYLLDDPARCRDEPYLALLRRPTATTVAMLTHSTRLLARMLYTVVVASGGGVGAIAAYWPAHDRSDEPASAAGLSAEESACIAWHRLAPARLATFSGYPPRASPTPSPVGIVTAEFASADAARVAIDGNAPNWERTPELFSLELALTR